METRKVQLTGKSTFIISLPKTWVNDTGIKARDSIGVIPQPDGTLLLSPKMIKGKLPTKKEITVDKNEEKIHLLRKLIGAYITGYNIIEIRSRYGLTPENKHTAKKFTRIVIGPEIIDEDANSMVMKDLLDPTDFSFKTAVRRMYYIGREMHENVAKSLEDRDVSLSQDVKDRDEEINRLNWLVARQNNMLLSDISLAEKMGTTRKRSLNYMLIARILERIGDHASKIADSIISLEEKEVDKEIIASIVRANDLSLKILDKSMGSLFNKDIDMANDAIDSVDALINTCEEISERVMKLEGKIALSLGYILESIRRTALYAADISETVMNHLIDGEDR